VIEQVLLQTNSTVTTTVFQQGIGASFLGEFLTVIVGVVLGSVITIVVTIVNNRAADRRLTLQLRRDDVLAGLTELHNISTTKYKTYEEFEHRINSFLGTLQAAFLPDDLKTLVQSEMKRVDEFMINAEIRPPPDQYSEEDWAEAYDHWRESLPRDEQAFMELKDMFSALRAKIRREVEQRARAI
jgi:hypothetical protein